MLVERVYSVSQQLVAWFNRKEGTMVGWALLDMRSDQPLQLCLLLT